ncbi:hypothetical protein E6O75_ATG01710 [Venturia nashicola]|uniref:Uncharacterized protein n=1 Tax=Venturia nashicola TaxID=86259 RepID=A0A4Z1NIR9_9PEZI|nr:hypothetical protein E6O75_ATG01710 [Venturia nashicola]
MNAFVDYGDSCEVDMLASLSQAAYGFDLEQGQWIDQRHGLVVDRYSNQEDDDIAQCGAAIISSNCFGMPEGHRGLGDFSLTTEPYGVEDGSFSDHNPKITQYHTVPSPAPSYDIQNGNFVHAFQHYGGCVLVNTAPTPDTRSDSMFGSGFSPGTPQSLDEYIDAIL